MRYLQKQVAFYKWSTEVRGGGGLMLTEIVTVGSYRASMYTCDPKSIDTFVTFVALYDKSSAFSYKQSWWNTSIANAMSCVYSARTPV